MDAAEYVVSEDERMALAALALDSLSDAVSNESILHFIATLDTEAELQLIIRTGGGTATNVLGNGFSFMPILSKSSLCHATVMQCQSGTVSALRIDCAMCLSDFRAGKQPTLRGHDNCQPTCTKVDIQNIWHVHVHAGQEVLEVFLSDPAVMGQHIGSLLDAVANTQRLERSVLRNDEVCTYSPVEGIYDRKIGGVLALPLLLFLPGYTAAEMSLHGCTAAEVEGRLVHPTLFVWERSLC
jgi:hypothetical protein